MKTNFQDPQTSEMRSTHISGLQEAVGKIEDILDMQLQAETGIELTEVYLSVEDRYRIYQAPAGKRNWASSPAPVIKKNTVVVTEGFTIDYAGGSIIVSPSAISTDVFTADASYTKVAGNKLETHLADNAINILSPPVPLVGAKANGTIETIVVQNLLNFAGANGKSIEIPDKTFIVANLTSGGCKFIFGHGENSVLKSTTSSIILTLDADSTIVNGVKFEGGGLLNQKGIVNSGKFKCEAINCIFDNLRGVGGGIFVDEVGTSQHGLLDGMKITNCKFYRCTHGIDCGFNAEYVNIDGCTFQNQCGWAIWCESGNVLIHGCNISKTCNGIYISKGLSENGAHGGITACNINHIFTDNGDSTYTTGYGLWFQDVTLGESVTGCQIFDANIVFINSIGVNINNGTLGVVKYLFDGSYGCSIENNYLYRAYGHEIQNAVEGHPSHISWENNKNYDGTHGASIEEIKGGQVIGAPTGQTIATGAAETIIAVTAVSNSANYPNQAKHAWWNAATNKAKNLGYGGNRLKIDVQIYVEYGGGANVGLTLGYLSVGTKTYPLYRIDYSTNVYYGFTGEVIAEPNEEIYIQLLNNSGQTATVTATNGRFIVEGL